MLRGRAVVMAATMRAAALGYVAPRVPDAARARRGGHRARAPAHRTPWVDARPRGFAAVPASAASPNLDDPRDGSSDASQGSDASEGAPRAFVQPYVPQPPDYAGAGACVPAGESESSRRRGGAGHVALVDGMSVIFRSHYGWQSRGNPLLDSKGHDISVLYSVAHAVLAVMELESVTHLAVCFDAKGKTFRHEMFADYKANRPATPPEIKKAIPEVITMLKQMNIPVLTLAGVEADDIIGTVARRAVAELGFRVSIISPDKDFFQLLGPRVRQLRPNGKNFVDSEGVIVQRPNTDAFADYHERNLSGKGLVPYTESDFRNEFANLDPKQFVDVLAMVGDASDNVPGVEGVGPKTAPRLLKLYGNIEGCVENAQTTNDIKNKRVRENLKSPKGAASAYLCRNLVKIRTELNAPTLASPALTFEGPGSLELRHRVPPEDEGAAIGEYLERGLELGSAADRWRDLCRKRGGRSSG
jgi:DNA polymerase-1